MKFLIVLAAVAFVANAGYLGAPSVLARAPAFDSAVIKSDRLGGNFAYSTAENHAYAHVSPVVQHVATPVAVSYSAPAVVAKTYAAPIAAPAYAYSGLGYAAYGHAYGHGLYGGNVIAY